MLSMDALFGLPGKQSAGQSLQQAIHGHLYFRNQLAVDEFVASAAQNLRILMTIDLSISSLSI